MAEEEIRTQENSIGDMLTKITKVRWQLVVQEATIWNLQKNQVEQQKLELENYNDTKQELLKSKVEHSLSVVRRELLYKKFKKMEPIEFDGSMDLDEADEWLHSIQKKLEFTEVDDKEKVWCVSWMRKKRLITGGRQLEKGLMCL